MELLKEMLVEILAKQECKVKFDISDEVLVTLFRDTCFSALEKIKAIIERSDKDDFGAMEEIVCILEALGSNGGTRHDF